MSNFNIVASAISTMVSLLLLWVFLQWFYRDYRIDVFRQKIFALRDELFDLARNGVIGFDDPAYGALRTTLNGLIRFADRIGIIEVSLTSVAMEREEGGTFEAFDDVLARLTTSLSDDQVRAVDRIMQRMHWLIVRHLILGSPTLMATMVPVLCGLILRNASGKTMRKVRREMGRRFADPVSSIAFRVGMRTA